MLTNFNILIPFKFKQTIVDIIKFLASVTYHVNYTGQHIWYSYMSSLSIVESKISVKNNAPSGIANVIYWENSVDCPWKWFQSQIVPHCSLQVKLYVKRSIIYAVRGPEKSNISIKVVDFSPE